MSWVKYWNGKPSIYVSRRHIEAHDFDIAFSIVRNLPRERGRVLDFGCGEATRARYVAGRCDKLLLWDAAPNVQDRLNKRYAKDNRIQVLSAECISQLPDASLDLVVMSSVVQYMTVSDLSAELKKCHRWLAPHGRLVMADIIPRNVGVMQDSLELLRFARSEGFLGHAIAGLARTAFSDYWSTRARLRLTKFDEEEMVHLLQSCGFIGERLDRNFGHNQRRFAFAARPVHTSMQQRVDGNRRTIGVASAHLS